MTDAPDDPSRAWPGPVRLSPEDFPKVTPEHDAEALRFMASPEGQASVAFLREQARVADPYRDWPGPVRPAEEAAAQIARINRQSIEKLHRDMQRRPSDLPLSRLAAREAQREPDWSGWTRRSVDGEDVDPGRPYQQQNGETE